MEIASIKNINTKQEVCQYYLHKKLNMNKTEIVVGKPLRIVQDEGTFFTHEIVVNVECIDEVTIKVETTRKIWILQN